jgi:hypothetical protein
MPAAERDRRRPRTCFMSTSSQEEVERADLVIDVRGGTAKEVTDLREVKDIE